ncbi:MAG: hypothetical protein ABIY70_21245 [Capsulimonas sp.]|uniref:hypothetical protein n=1 Tax=Capsulimonas sp. TaxID=2494211 RepID=UPI003265743B
MTLTGNAGPVKIDLRIISDSGAQFSDVRTIGVEIVQNGRQLNYSAPADTATPAVPGLIAALATSLAAQTRAGQILANKTYTGTATDGNAITHTAVVVVRYCTPNTDGLVVTIAPIDNLDQVSNPNVGMPATTDDVDATVMAADAQFQALADSLAADRATNADQTQGLINLVLTGTA